VTFESGFEDAERAASVATKSASTLVSAPEATGRRPPPTASLAALRTQGCRARGGGGEIGVAGSGETPSRPGRSAWMQRSCYLRESYVDELLEAARAEGVTVQQLDDGYLPASIRPSPSFLVSVP